MTDQPKKTIPAQKFDTKLNSGSIKSASSDAGAKKGELLLVPVDQIDEIEGFNVRIETPDYIEHVEAIARSILANGFYQNKPLAAYVAKGEDGKSRFKLTDGYTRLRATRRAIEQGAEIETLPVVVKPQTNSVEDLLVALVQDNEGRPLNPFERAVVVKRLENFLWSDEQIAERLGITTRYVGDLKVLAGAPAKVRDMVVKGKVSATEAVKALRKDAKSAGDVLTEAVKTAEASGKAKATGKDVKKASEKAAPAPKTGFFASASEKDGVTTQTMTWRYKQGEIVETTEIKPSVWHFGDAAWWDYVDEKQDPDHVVINEDVEIVVTIKLPTKEESNEGSDDGDGESAGQIEDQSGDDEPSVDHAAGEDTVDPTEGL